MRNEIHSPQRDTKDVTKEHKGKDCFASLAITVKTKLFHKTDFKPPLGGLGVNLEDTINNKLQTKEHAKKLFQNISESRFTK